MESKAINRCPPTLGATQSSTSDKPVSTIKIYLKNDCIKKLDNINYLEFGSKSLLEVRTDLGLGKLKYFFRDSD